MIELGEINYLKVKEKNEKGYILTDDQNGEILLPLANTGLKPKIGDELSVFIYKTNDNLVVASTRKPLVLLHQFALLEVTDVNDKGAFLNWGLEKDLLLPFREQGVHVSKGDKVLIYVYLDEQTERLVASAKINHFLENKTITVESEEEVNLIVAEQTDLGYNVIINHLHKGLVYKNEVFSDIKIGDKMKGYIRQVRPDGKIDVRLQKPGQDHVVHEADRLLIMLRKSNGFIALNDKSTPEEIHSILGMSKKTFKKAAGSLYKSRIVSLEENGIRLTNDLITD